MQRTATPLTPVRFRPAPPFPYLFKEVLCNSCGLFTAIASSPHLLGGIMKKIHFAMVCASFALFACTAEDNGSEISTITDQVESSLATTESTPSAKRPNFLIITTDDMGYTDLGAFGGLDIPTPNLDTLAMQGIRLTNFHASVSCSPTRSMLMSGTGNHEAGVGSQQIRPEFEGQIGYESLLSDRVVSLPERMVEAGYHTYLAGKWHLSGEAFEVLPSVRGFERSFALIPGGWDHYATTPQDEKPDVGYSPDIPYTEDGQLVTELPDDFYSTTAYVDKMIGYMESNESSGQPFFAWFSPTAPHWPLQVLPEWKDRFAGHFDQGYEALCYERQQNALEAGVLSDGVDMTLCPELAQPWDSLSDEEKALNRRSMELYAAMAAHMDTEFGRILEYLELSGQLDNTYIIYHNDNGPAPNEILDNRGRLDRFDNSFENLGNRNSWINVGPGWTDAQSAPYREHKGSPFEGGIRVPAFIWSAGSEQTGRISDSMLTIMDVMPTIMELAGIEEADYPRQDALPIRGKSFTALLENESAVIHGSDEYIALDHSDTSFLREGDWKIVRKPGWQEWQLYNTQNDPSEQIELSEQHPEKLADLVAKFENHAQELGILRRVN